MLFHQSKQESPPSPSGPGVWWIGYQIHLFLPTQLILLECMWWNTVLQTEEWAINLTAFMKFLSCPWEKDNKIKLAPTKKCFIWFVWPTYPVKSSEICISSANSYLSHTWFQPVGMWCLVLLIQNFQRKIKKFTIRSITDYKVIWILTFLHFLTHSLNL